MVATCRHSPLPLNTICWHPWVRCGELPGPIYIRPPAPPQAGDAMATWPRAHGALIDPGTRLPPCLQGQGAAAAGRHAGRPHPPAALDDKQGIRW